jgi:hypothetical protein
MDNQPAIDRSLLTPLLIGGFSIIGIIIVLLIGRSLNSPAEVPVTPSATRFQYLYLGTEPAITTPILEDSEIPLTEEPIEEPIVDTPVFATPTRPTAATPIILTPSGTGSTPTGGVLLTNTPGGLATATLSSPVAANTYDDTDSRLAYTGNWVPQTTVAGAYQNTLHVSDAAGNSVSFNFVGQEIQFYYQAGASLGTVNITFDNQPQTISLSQAQSSGVWTYLLDTAGNHTVTISHAGGGAVNIDRLVIPALTVTATGSVTVTPTRTPTPTP